MAEPVGRPRMYKTPEAMQKKISEYFKDCPDRRTIYLKDTEREVPCPTITGLALFLGFCDRHSMYAYETNMPEFSNTIKRARAFMERIYETYLLQGNCTGAIFALKNFGWVDKSEVDTKLLYQKMPTIKDDDGKPLKFEVGDD